MSHILLTKISELSKAIEKQRQQETSLIQANEALQARYATLNERYQASLAAIAALESKITGEIKALDLELENVYTQYEAAKTTIATYKRFARKVAEMEPLPIVADAQ